MSGERVAVPSEGYQKNDGRVMILSSYSARSFKTENRTKDPLARHLPGFGSVKPFREVGCFGRYTWSAVRLVRRK